MKIRYYGHVGQSTGYGRAASDLCMALLGAGAELEIRPLSPPNARHFTDAYLPLASCVRRDGELDPAPHATIVHTIPVDCLKVKGIVQGGPTKVESPWIAYTTWEALTRPPELRAAMCEFDQVWHPCRANAEALTGRAPPRILPHCFEPATLATRRAPYFGDVMVAQTGDRPFRFYYVGAFTERKNVAGVVEAFRAQFADEWGVTLTLHCAGAGKAHALSIGLDQQRDPATWQDDGQVFLHTDFVGDHHIAALHAIHDCFVTASRGEAWNLPCFDAVLAGRHVLAPVGLGSDDYLDGTDATQFVTAAPANALWLEPDLEMLSRQMRAVYEGRVRNLFVNYDLVELYGYPAVAKLTLNYLQECFS